MSETAAANSSIVIDRWRNTFVVAENTYRRPATQEVLRRIERALAEDLPRSCIAGLGQWSARPADGVWLIRQLALDFVVDVSKPGANDVAPACSEQFAVELAGVLQRGPDSDAGVLYFASRSSYIAQFVLDLIAGQVWSKWYYEEFRSLAMLSTSRAVAEVFSREPENGAKAIVYLAQTARLDEVLPVLTAVDARTIYYCCFKGSAGMSVSAALASDSSSLFPELQAGRISFSGPDFWLGRLLEVAKDERVRAHRLQTSFHEALRWLALVGARFPGAVFDDASCAAVEGLIELRRVLEEIRSPIAADRLVRRVVEGEISLEEAIEIASRQGSASPGKALRFLVMASQGDADWAMQAAAVLLQDQLAPLQAVVASESMISAFAGMFLLGPALVRLNQLLDEVAGEGEDAKEVASFLRYMILVKCVGGPRFLAAEGDTALRLMSGCHRLRLQDWRQVCQAIELNRAYTLFLHALPALADCDNRCLLAETFATPDHKREVILVRDCVRNEWVYAQLVEPESRTREEALTAALNRAHESTGDIPIVLLHPSLAALAESAMLRQQAARVITLQEEVPSADVNDALLSARYITQAKPREKYAQLLRSSGPDFSYFSFADVWPEVDLEFDLFGTLLSRAVMREFARHLLGFQNSSPEHLYTNFLEGIGTVRQQPERIEVELPRSHLLLVLQLSGSTRQTYVLPWLEGKEVCLLPPKQ
jgi:hypothetical protein